MDIMNLSAIYAKYGISENDYDTRDPYVLYDIVTIGDLLTFTPDVNMSECTYRDMSGNYVKFGNETECNEVFKLRKYVHGQYVCYELTSKLSNPPLTFRSVSTSLQYDRSIYEIRFAGQHAMARKIRPTITIHRYPTMANIYAATYYKASTEDLSLHIACQNITNYWLGYPYDLFTCQKEGGTTYSQCTDSCIKNNSVSMYNRLPFTSFYDYTAYSESDTKLISLSMIKNAT